MKPPKVRDLRVSDFMTTEVVTASPDDDLGDVLGKMKKHDIHEIPILDGKRLVGVITMRDLMRRRALPPSTKVSTLVMPSPNVAPDLKLPAAAEQLVSTGFRALPVVEKSRIVGILSRTDLVRALVGSQALTGIRARDLMTPNLQVVREGDTVDVAVRTMAALGERSIPVVNARGALSGVLGMKDVADYFAKPKARQEYGERAGREEKVAIEVKSAMHYPPVTVGPDADVHHAAELMLRHDVSSVVVVEDGQPIGILTKADLMHFFAGLQEREQIFVEISGLEDEPAEAYDRIYETIQKEMKRIGQLTSPRTLSLHVQKYKPEGDRWKYSLRCRYQTAHRLYYANHYDWDLDLALTGLLEGLYHRLVKEKERRITETKRHHVRTGSRRAARRASPRQPRRAPSRPRRGPR